MLSTSNPSETDDRLERLLGVDRIGAYIEACDGDRAAAIELYRWNAAISAALWQPLSHLEIALRNALADRLAARLAASSLPGSWLDDPCDELGASSHAAIAAARKRVRRKGKRPSEGQTVSELGFGFWCFLVTRRHTALWPDLASAFPHAPDRRRETVEDPIARLHELRNRIAHHQRIWNRDLAARYDDLLLVAGFLDPGLPGWIGESSGVPAVLSARRARRPA